MIITLFISALLVLLIAALIICFRVEEEREINVLACSACIFGCLVALFVCCSTIISENLLQYEVKAQSLQVEREAIIYQMEHNIYLGGTLGDFNKRIIEGRFYHDNPWTSWFYGDYYYKVDPIQMNDSEQLKEKVLSGGEEGVDNEEN